MKITSKWMLSFCALLALVLGFGYLSLHAIGRLGASLSDAVGNTARKLQLVGELRGGFQEMRAEATKTEISLINSLVNRVAAPPTEQGGSCSTCHSQDAVAGGKARFEDVSVRLTQQVAALRPLLLDKEKQSVDTVANGIAAWHDAYQEYISLLAGRHFAAAHEIMLGKIYPLIETMDKAANDLSAQQEAALRLAKQDGASSVSQNRAAALVFLGVCLLTGLGGFQIVRGVNGVLRRFVGDVKSATEHVASAAHAVNASSASLAQGAAQQAASLEQTSASSEEIAAMTRHNLENSESASQVAGEVDAQVEKANQTLAEMVNSMQAINASSLKISSIVKLIDEIAFQTNMLALNAAVEAARAGESGLGFAVVAEEVRNLAQRSAQAARDTAALIEESIARSREGSDKLTLVAESIGGITDRAASVRRLVDDVKLGSREQANGTQEISKAIAHIEAATQEAVSNAERSAAAGGDLQGQSETLRDVVDRLAAML